MKALLMAAVAAMMVAGTVCGQTFPNKPVRIIPGSPGGGGWILSEYMRDLLSKRLGQPIILEHRPANLMGGILARAEPDGHTLLHAGAAVWYAPLLDKTDYDFLSFAPITAVGTSPFFLVTHPSVPANSVKELIAFAKSQPGKLNYAASAIGSGYFITGEMFKSMAGVDIQAIPYSGGGPTLQAVISGQVQMSFIPPEGVIHLVRAGKLKALAHTRLKPTPLAPDLPPMSDTLPGFDNGAYNGFFAPARTPQNVIARLNRDAVWVLNQDEIKKKFLDGGVDPLPTTPEEFAALVKTRYATVSQLLKSHGIGQK